MTAIDDLIGTARGRAEWAVDEAAVAIRGIGTNFPYINYEVLPLEPSEFDAKYKSPNPDKTAMPVYHDPSTPIPKEPNLVDLSGIAVPGFPDAPTINTNGLFDQQQPDSNIPDWTEANPVLHAEDIYNEMQALAMPILTDVEIPGITPISIHTPPELQLPDYEAYATPEAIPAATNYASYMQAKYDAALPEMKAFVDDVVNGWIAQYAPEYEEQRSKLHQRIMEGLDGGVLPDQFETALYNRAKGRTQKEFDAAAEAVLSDTKKRGFIVPPGSITAGLNKVRIGAASAAANQATDVYIERRKSEVQHLQLILTTAASQVQAVRSLAMQAAQSGLELIARASAQADAICAKMIVLFEHERSRREFSLAIMRELNNQYEVKLKSALSGLEGYKLELQALEARSDVEAKQIDAAKAQLSAQQVMVDRYSAMIDAIAKRAVADELLIKDYSVRADVFKTNVNARLAAFDAYKAAIDGDKAKLSGELAKLDIYNGQLKAVELNLEAQGKVLDADVKTNAAKLGQYNTQLDGYKIASQVALQKFTAQAEIKKLGMEVYNRNVEANLAVYEGELKKDIAWVQSKIEAFRGNIESKNTYYKLQQGYSELELKKTTSIADGYSNMASAALQSLNTTVSQAEAI